MFGLFRRSVPQPLSDPIRRAIEQHGSTSSDGDASRLRMVELGGRYSDRKVTYFRVFDPSTTAECSLDVRGYADFNDHPGLVLRSGHVERDGTVVLTRAVAVRAAEPTVRANADRAMHADDAHIVRGETGASATMTADATPQAGPAPHAEGTR